MRRTLAVLAVVSALAAGCGDTQPTRETTPSTTAGSGKAATTDLADVKVEGAIGTEPTITFDAPFALEATESLTLTEGDGATIAADNVISLDFVFVNGRTNEVIASSYEAEPTEIVYSESLMPGIFTGLDGVTSGSRVLVGIAPGDGPGEDPTSDVLETDTLLFFAEVLDVRSPLARAEGTAVPPVAGLPTVELADDGTPTITVPDADPPAELVAQPLIDGTGPVVESGQNITVHYTGLQWDDGVVFDSSWESGSPASFSIGTGAVIPGWDEGLVGVTVGSQILLVIPPDLGYPERGTIVFVVDILDAS